MKFTRLELPGVLLVEPTVFGDERGFFLETYHFEKYQAGGIEYRFVQDNHSLSKGGILRGLHAQVEHPQGKLVRCIEGEIFDVAVDIRRGSPSFLHWVGATLTAANHHQLFIPPGFAHGFAVLSDRAQVTYKCTEIYRPEDEIVIHYADPQIGISWPLEDPVTSERDATAKTAAELADSLPTFSR